jgi:hypothetical protein
MKGKGERGWVKREGGWEEMNKAEAMRRGAIHVGDKGMNKAEAMRRGAIHVGDKESIE